MKISATQWFWLLLSSRLSQCLLLPSDSLHRASVPDLLIVTVLNAAVLLALTALLRFLPSRVYTVLALIAVTLDCFRFADFASKTSESGFPVWLLVVGLIAVGFAAALYGLEALARTASVVGVVSLVLLLLGGILLLPRADLVCFPPSVVGSVSSLAKNTLVEVPRTAELVAVGALASSVNGNGKRAVRWFIVASSALTLGVCLVTTAILGDATAHTPYPFFTALSAAPVRLDAIVLTLWLCTFFMRLSLLIAVIKRRTV